MNAPWSPNEPIEKLFNQINKAKAFARGHGNISNQAGLRSGLKNLENSGVFPLALKDWRSKPAADQTWASFQAHFEAANVERLRTVAAKQAGYHDQHPANAANKTTTPTL